MFQACVSISDCIFYVFMNIYSGYVCINGHTAGGKKITDLPYFSVACYANTIFFGFLALGGIRGHSLGGLQLFIRWPCALNSPPEALRHPILTILHLSSFKTA